MSLIDRIAVLPSALPSPGEPVRLTLAVENVRQRFGDRQPAKPETLDALVLRLTQAVRNWQWTALTDGEIGQVVRGWAARIIRVSADVDAFLLRELSRCTRLSLLGALCEGFVAGWTAQESRTAELGRIIQNRAAWLPRAWQAVFRAIPESLDANAGALRFGQWLAQQPDPYVAALARGVVAPHGPGFMAAVHAAWLMALPEPTEEPTIRRMLAWLHPTGAPALVGDRATATVARLLYPWRIRMPSKALRTLLLDALLRHHGDPRRDNPDFWARVGEEGKRVVLRWLAGQRMEAFLEVVSRSEEKLEAGDQWPVRRRFWMGLYDEGRIDEAWPSFGGDAAVMADSLARTTGDPAYAAYGRQIKRKDTSLLIMRIGRYVVVEGSHNFRVHVFRQDRAGGPSLYASQYNIEDFLLPQGDRDARMHDSAGNWMRWVREKIR